ncbi:hypothetical protein [Bathymodiolus japonicus methanotrophic gill symbiont]|uniref:hypothetical protein n=1 Tax=Bathymodiolus japonicus methanotrophic gill symbiont TaxID=113269 RepID=UPI001C8EFAC7|nr:hypothetical protein [Bathymodiolus japonicus methanotrophic gill symbiont]
MRSRCGRRAFRASPIRCVGERIMATGVPEFREVAWRACFTKGLHAQNSAIVLSKNQFDMNRICTGK